MSRMNILNLQGVFWYLGCEEIAYGIEHHRQVVRGWHAGLAER